MATATTAPADAAVTSDDDSFLHRRTGQRFAVFGLTWLAYAVYYFGRKGFPVVKSTLSERFGLSVGTLGAIDTGYLAAYALGQFVNGHLGDRIGSRRLLGIGMLGVAAACTLFGMSSLAAMFFAAYICNGLFQSSGWPSTVKAMGAWFTPRERGTVMGIWSTCYQAGGLAGTAVATFLFVHYGWRWAFFGPAIVIATVGALNFLLLPERTATPTARPAANLPLRGDSANARTAIWRSPVLWSLGASYFCLKLIRYSLLFWLPFYFNTVLGYSKSQAGYRSISFEVGGIVGSIAIGFISDRYFPGRRRIISAIMVAALAAALLLYARIAPISPAMNFAGMALVGFCLFGPDTIICGAAAQDLGGKHDVAKAAGFIDGLGSLGAILQGVITSSVSARYGWNGLFYLFAAIALVSCIALTLGKKAVETRIDTN